MKIAIATPLYPPQIGGPATYAKTLETELPKKDVSVVVVPFSSTEGYPKYVRHIVYGYRLFRATKDVDIILALDPTSVGVPSLLVSWMRGKPLILRVPGDYAWEQGVQRFGVTDNLDVFVKNPANHYQAQVGLLRAAQTFVAGRARHIITPSNYLKSIVHAWGIPEEKISAIYNAFDGIPELPVRAQLREELHFNDISLVSAGRLVPWKGYSELIDVVQTLRTEFPITLYVIGSGPDEQKLKEKIATLGLAKSVLLLGQLPQETLMRYIKAADCFVLNTGYEGLSHQLLEVMALGTPIVTTPVGGNPEIITHEKSGLLATHNDRDMFAAHIRRMCSDDTLRATCISGATTHVQSFTVLRMIDETYALLQKIDSSKR